MPPMWGLGAILSNGRTAARSSSPAPSSLVNSPPARGIMTLGTKITCSFRQHLGLTFSRLTWQRGVQWTWEGLHHRFWWATLEEDTHEFVNACPFWNQHKPCHQAPAPSSLDSHPLILVCHYPYTEVDWFSKMAHFVPLPKLPTSSQPGSGLHL